MQNKWLFQRKDHTLSGNAGIHGNMPVPPQIRAAVTLAKTRYWLAAAPGEGNTVCVSRDTPSARQQEASGLGKWFYSAPQLLENPLLTEKYETGPYFHNGKLGYFIPGEKRLQWIQCENSFDAPMGTIARPGENEDEDLNVRMYVLEGGDWQLLWETHNLDILAVAQPVIGDFDGDGMPELCVTPWYNAHFFDIATGREKYVCRCVPENASSGRAYGMTIAWDIDGDGVDEAVVVGAFENHMCVLKYIDGEMRQSWAKLFEHGIVLKKTLVHISRSPVGDFDGDGRAELALSVLNENGDNAWHTLILEAATGAVKQDLYGCHLLDIRTVEGIPLLFLSKTEGSVVTQAVDVAYLKDGQPVTIYTAPLGFACDVGVRSAPYISYQRSVAAVAGIDTEGTFLFFERTEQGLRMLRLAAPPDGGAAAVRAVGEITSSHPVSVVSMQSAGGEALISVEAAETEAVSVSGTGIALDYVASHPGEFVGAQPLVADFADGVTRVVVQSESDKIDVFAVEETDGDIRFARCFSVAGHGMATTNYKGPALLDIHGDRSYTLAAFTHEGGPALTLFDMQGGILWRKPFEDVEYHALVALMPGKLRGGAGDDLLIFIRKGDMHSEYGIAIDGRNGDTLWERHEGVFGLAFGGEMTAIDDINGDGQNEVIIIYPHNIAIHEGKTGALLASATTLNEPRFWGDPVSFYASPSTYDFLGNGTKQFLYGASNYVHAVIDFAQNELKKLWETLYPMWAPALPTGIGDVDGDGNVEVYGPGWRAKVKGREALFRCVDARTGAEKWSFPIRGACYGYNRQIYGNSPTMTSTADLDGDGREEVLFGIQNTVMAVAVPQGEEKGRILWEVNLPGKAGSPTPAYLGGRACMLCACGDGKLYVIG